MKNTETIRKNFEFLRIYRKGVSVVGRYMVLYVQKNVFSKKRLGITASRKVGKSVVRNRLKRLVRESYNFYEKDISAGIDMIFIIRKVKKMPMFNDIKKEMRYLLRKQGLLDKESM